MTLTKMAGWILAIAFWPPFVKLMAFSYFRHMTFGNQLMHGALFIGGLVVVWICYRNARREIEERGAYNKGRIVEPHPRRRWND